MIVPFENRCIIQILPGHVCNQRADKPLVFKGKQIMVCKHCYNVIMDKLAERLKRSDNGTKRLR